MRGLQTSGIQVHQLLQKVFKAVVVIILLILFDILRHLYQRRLYKPLHQVRHFPSQEQAMTTAGAKEYQNQAIGRHWQGYKAH